MEYVVIRTGGKQYKVSTGSVIDVDRINSEKDKEIILDDVLLWVNDEKVKIGKPNLPDVKIKAKVIDNIKGEKIKVAKFKAKARHRRMTGFRAYLTRLEIKSIDSGKTEVKASKKASKPSV